MKWTYLMYMPSVVSALWALAIFVTKKRPTRAQLLFSAAMLMVAFAEVMATVIFRGRTQCLFIYQYLFELVASLCGPVFYIAVCALAEPRGSSLPQRHSLLLPLLFILGLSLTTAMLGPRRYEHLCLLFRYGMLFPLEGDRLWNFAAVWNYPVFVVIMVGMNVVLLFLSSRKSSVFQRRFNSYYADNIGAPKLNSRPLHLLAWCFLPLAVVAVVSVALRPPYAKYLLIATALLMAALQFFVGRYIYSLNYDARYLAQLVKRNQ